MQHQVLLQRTLKKISTYFDINVDTPKKGSFNDQKNENKDNIDKLYDINIKLSSNNNFPNKCKTINDNLGINDNKSNNSPLKIKDNKLISKVDNDSSNINNNNKINDNNNKNNNNNSNNNDNDNDNNINNYKYNINENDKNLATNDYGKCNHDNTSNKIGINKNKL